MMMLHPNCKVKGRFLRKNTYFVKSTFYKVKERQFS
jgi:hypothetical protein